MWMVKTASRNFRPGLWLVNDLPRVRIMVMHDWACDEWGEDVEEGGILLDDWDNLPAFSTITLNPDWSADWIGEFRIGVGEAQEANSPVGSLCFIASEPILGCLHYGQFTELKLPRYVCPSKDDAKYGRAWSVDMLWGLDGEEYTTVFNAGEAYSWLNDWRPVEGSMFT